MATVPTHEVLDLRHFPAASLRELLEIECRIWNQRLRWDYRPAANLLAQYFDSRILPGFVTLEAGKATGYTFCVYEGSKAVIGDLFASGSDQPAIAQEAILLRHMLEMLQNSPDVDRIESQLLLHPHGALKDVFGEAGFISYPRLFLEQKLANRPIAEHLHAVPGNMELRSWTSDDFAAAARLIPVAYSNHLDSQINDQYNSEAGARRFLHNIVRFPGCGVFDTDSSLVLAHRDSKELAGLLLCSRVREDVGHITQICIHPEYQRLGLGSLLLEHVSRSLEQAGLRLLTLTVTRDNHNAAELYLARGFQLRHTFDARVWTKEAPHFATNQNLNR
jgi:ribosomal protein S18 acetylase RimI-like enzyme